MTDTESHTTDPDPAHAPAGPRTGDEAAIDAEFEEAPDEAPRAKRRWGVVLLVLILAIVLAIAAVIGFGYWELIRVRVLGLEPRVEQVEEAAAPDSDVIAALEARIAALESRPEPEPPAPEVTAEQFAELSQTVSGAATQADLEALRAEIPDETGPAISDEEIATLRGELETLRADLLEAQTSADDDTLETLRGQIADLRSAMERQREIATQVTTLDGRVDSLEQGAPDLSPVNSQLQSVEARLQAMDARLNELSGRVAQVPAQGDLTALNQRLANLEARMEERTAEAAYRYAALRDAAARGAPFEPERAALARLRPDDAELSAMRDAATAGVPTFDELRASWPGAAIRAAAEAEPAEPGRFAWAQAMADRVVTVRREDEEASPAAEIAAETEAALEAGDLAAAVAAAEALEGAPAEAAAYWLGRARQRVALNARVEQIGNALMAEAAQ